MIHTYLIEQKEVDRFIEIIEPMINDNRCEVMYESHQFGYHCARVEHHTKLGESERVYDDLINGVE